MQYLDIQSETGVVALPESLSYHGNSLRFEELALPLLPSIHDFARCLSRSRTEADDLVQDTYLRALRGFRTFEDGSNFRAWMFQILRNTFFSSRTGPQYRQRYLHLPFDELTTPLQSRFPDPAEILLCQARLVAMQFAIQKLPSFHRAVFILCDVEGASYQETAEALSIPLGTVMSRLARARKAIRKSVQDHAIRRRPRNIRNSEIN